MPEELEQFLEDGELDAGELQQLEVLRKELGIDSDDALQLLRSIQQEAAESRPSKCPHCGGSIS